MPYKVRLYYFRLNGKYVAFGEFESNQEYIEQIWEDVHDMRRMGRMPNLRPNSGKDLVALIDVINHPNRELHLVAPPIINDEDVTPVHVPIVKFDK